MMMQVQVQARFPDRTTDGGAVRQTDDAECGVDVNNERSERAVDLCTRSSNRSVVL